MAVQSWPGYPLVVAANRDERVDRPARPPFFWPGKPASIAPRDEQAGGTWLGLNARGLFVGITNRMSTKRDDSRASRGALVQWALTFESAKSLHDAMSSVDPKRYNPFHLLYADRREAFLSWSSGEQLTQQVLSPGLHVVTERSFGAADDARERFVHERWPKQPTSALVEQLTPVLTEHATLSPFRGTCIHAKLFNYGTRSSLILGVAEQLGDTRFHWAEGSPCTHPFVEQTELVSQLAKEAQATS
jgi:uncharacterized protein with NRDE domain